MEPYKTRHPGRPMVRPRQHLFLRLLRLCPVLVAILWVAGVARFRGYELTAKEWAVVVVGGFALHLVMNRAAPVRPMTPLPAGTSPRAVATLAATMLAGLAAVLGGVFEWVAAPPQPGATSWALRTTWHAACVFAASYCSFLLRLHVAPRQAP